MNIEINGYNLILTCGACPEQYDVCKDNVVVGYMRLRHGRFTVNVPDCLGKQVYSACPRGDGVFDNEEERMKHLTEGIIAIQGE